ncbi:MAG: glycosyltransferase family 39 protein [Mesorhizobium sp.]
MSASVRTFWLPGVMLLLFAAAISFRPLLPIDETRYMSVAWEMALRHDWLHPLTMNFEPYHQKPPLLFWLINASWSIFGISRWAGLVPVVLASGSTVLLTAALGRLLMPSVLHDRNRTALVMVSSVPFLAYSTLVLFDLTVTVFVLSALICLVKFSRGGSLLWMVAAGFCIGLGVLTKGPVAYLYTLFPMVLGPLWRESAMRPGRWFGGVGLALLVSALPVLMWLVPTLRQADGNFAFWLVWGQTAGRISGSFGDSHARPFYFYLPLLPVVAVPWLFFRSFWKGMADVEKEPWSEGTRFLLWWLVPTFFCFCLISGKQPHYLVPLLPGAVLFMALCLRKVSTADMAQTLAVMVGILVVGQAIASPTFFKSYDLRPVAEIMRANPEADWAYVRNYHAEVGFLGSARKPLADVPMGNLAAWFAAHPQGFAIVSYRNEQGITRYQKLIDMPYRDRRLRVVRLKRDEPIVVGDGSS